MNLQLLDLGWAEPVPQHLMPQGDCYLWQPGLISLHAAADLLMALAYGLIPPLLIYGGLRRKNIPCTRLFNWLCVLIWMASASHFMEYWTVWHPAYWLAGIIKVIAAGMAGVTVLVLISVLVRSLALPWWRSHQRLNARLRAGQRNHWLREGPLRPFSQQGSIAMCDPEVCHTFERAAVGIAHVGLEGQWQRVNQRLCDLLGYSREALLQGNLLAITHPDDRASAELGVRTELLRDWVDPETREMRWVCKDGREIWVNLAVSLVCRSSGEPDYFIVVAEDISDRKQVEETLFKAKELAEITLKSIGDAVITTNAQGRVTYLNPVAEKLTGWCNGDAVDQDLLTVFNIIHEVTREPAVNPVEMVLRKRCIVSLADHTLLIAKDGHEFAIEDSAAPIFDQAGALMGTVLVFRDVSQSREMSRQLSWQAQHDTLTGLVNRWRFEQELTQAIEDAVNDNQQHSLCYLDLDQFKIVNDTCGHIAGDELLRQVARMLQHNIRASDILARLGGDEFGILLYNCPIENARIIAQKLQRLIQDFRFMWKDRSFVVGASIGIVTLDGETRDLATVLSAADVACYAAKDAGRNRIHVYRANDQILNRQRSERQWTVKIRHALEYNQFRLYYQRITPTVPGNLLLSDHYEILVRMVDETGKLVPPMAFIPAAERYGLMPEIDRWVVQTFFASYETFAQQAIADSGNGSRPTFMLNLSGTSVCSDKFLTMLVEQLRTGKVPPHHICFEITETAAIANLSQAADFISKLRAFGCQFALDDFGSGMSSFGYLKNLPIDYLKIDGNFIRDILEDPVDYTIVEFISHISRTIGMKTIAEFVESQVVRDRLRLIGVDYVQGYGISIPTPLPVYVPGERPSPSFGKS
ncbi:MAG: EAL domain-containing protein [Synechococcales bacterium]|nr:EAL domain-containing protein [Synechococcales bacterium]